MKAIATKSAGKVMHMIFNRYGVIYDHVVPPHTTVTAAYYSDILHHRLLHYLCQKSPDKIRRAVFSAMTMPVLILLA